MESGVLVIKLLQNLPDEGHRIAQIGTVIRKQDAGILVNDRHLDSGRSGVDADMYRGGIVRSEGHPGHRRLGVAGFESLVLLLALEQGRLGTVGLGGAVLLEPVGHLFQIKFPVGVKRRAQSHEQ